MGNLGRSFIDNGGVVFGRFLWDAFCWVICFGGGLGTISTVRVWPWGVACALPKDLAFNSR